MKKENKIGLILKLTYPLLYQSRFSVFFLLILFIIYGNIAHGSDPISEFSLSGMSKPNGDSHPFSPNDLFSLVGVSDIELSPDTQFSWQ